MITLNDLNLTKEEIETLVSGAQEFIGNQEITAPEEKPEIVTRRPVKSESL